MTTLVMLVFGALAAIGAAVLAALVLDVVVTTELEVNYEFDASLN